MFFYSVLLHKKLNYIYTKLRNLYASEFSEHYQIRLIPLDYMISINKEANVILYVCGHLNIWGTRPNMIWESNQNWKAEPVQDPGF